MAPPPTVPVPWKVLWAISARTGYDPRTVRRVLLGESCRETTSTPILNATHELGLAEHIRQPQQRRALQRRAARG